MGCCFKQDSRAERKDKGDNRKSKDDKMKPITEKRDVQDRVIGWEYIPLMIFRGKGTSTLKSPSSSKFLKAG